MNEPVDYGLRGRNLLGWSKTMYLDGNYTGSNICLREAFSCYLVVGDVEVCAMISNMISKNEIKIKEIV